MVWKQMVEMYKKAAHHVSTDERGLETVEWALLLAAIVLIIGGIVWALGGQIASIFADVIGLLGG